MNVLHGLTRQKFMRDAMDSLGSGNTEDPRLAE